MIIDYKKHYWERHHIQCIDFYNWFFSEYCDALTGLATIHNRDYRMYEQRFLPTMNQEQFINMWRSVYSFFALETNQDIFTSLSRVGR